MTESRAMDDDTPRRARAGADASHHRRGRETQTRLPLPATARWPEGVWDIQAFAHGSMSAVLFIPRGTDYQSSHKQDELYIVVKGNGVLVIDGSRHSLTTGDALFVPANTDHRFIEFNNALVTSAIFWGPNGGESPPGQ
jgi:mannose-6-phosphate isomerase-like protein (cupin superfamily)